MRDAHNRIQTIINNEINTKNSLERRDRELRTMIILEALVYILTVSFYPINLIQNLISQHYNTERKRSIFTNSIFFLSFTALLLIFINRAAPFFYIYLIVSKPFRRNFIKLIIKFIYQSDISLKLSTSRLI
jgi:hypothetical protein